MQDPEPIHPEISVSHKDYEQIWNIDKYIELPRNFTLPTIDLFEAFERRRTLREFKALTNQDISTLLWFTQRHTGTFPQTPNKVTTPVPTFGGLASVRTIVLNCDGNAWLYDPEFHRAGIINVSKATVKSIKQEANQFFDNGQGRLLLFAASRALVKVYYKHPDSLVLRESGVITAALSLVSTAFNFSFCPLGILGIDWINKLLNTSEKIHIPAGAAVVGNR